MFRTFPVCRKECELVSCGLVYVCIEHGNIHICTRETCDCIVDMPDEHKQVCFLTGVEYLRDYENVYGYDEADENDIDFDYAMSLSVAGYDQKDEEAVQRFQERLHYRRHKRNQSLMHHDPSLRKPKEEEEGEEEKKSGKQHHHLSVNIEQSPTCDQSVSFSFPSTPHPSNPRKRKRKNKSICDMSDYEKKREYTNDSHLIKDALTRFFIKDDHRDTVFGHIYDTWIIANQKDAEEHKSKSTFYNLYMHIAVVFKYVQDGMNGVIPRVASLYQEHVQSNLSATEICSKLGVNSKHYTSCCTIFRNIMKVATPKNSI